MKSVETLWLNHYHYNDNDLLRDGCGVVFLHYSKIPHKGTPEIIQAEMVIYRVSSEKTGWVRS